MARTRRRNGLFPRTFKRSISTGEMVVKEGHKTNYLPRNRPSSIYARHGVDPDFCCEGYCHGHRSTPKTAQKGRRRLRARLREEFARILKESGEL